MRFHPVGILAWGLLTLVVAAGSGLAVRAQSGAPSGAVWMMPEIGTLPRDGRGALIREGRDLITATYAYVGPNVADAAKRYAGNNLACTNCHLSAGTRKFAIPLFGIYGDFPQYSARTGGSVS